MDCGHFLEEIESVVSLLIVRKVSEGGVSPEVCQRNLRQELRGHDLRPGHDGDDRDSNDNCTLDFV